MDPVLHASLAWIWMVIGMISGAVLGLGFHRENFAGGYGSWSRRLARLGHIAFFGTGMINLGAALACQVFEISIETSGVLVLWMQGSLLLGAVGMPTVCLLAAWKKPCRHAFPMPATGLMVGAVLMVWLLFSSG